MKVKRMIAVWYLYRKWQKKKNRGNRTVWVNPINSKRLVLGVFYTLFLELRNEEKKFFNYFRMSVSSFDELHDKLKDHLQRQNTVMRECIEPRQMLAVTIRYLASGCTFTDLHYAFRLGISTIRGIVQDVCRTIWCYMRKECFPELTQERWKEISLNFEQRANFPHCIGAVDGKHIRIINPLGSMYYNYKGYSSIVLMAVADSDYRFLYVDIGSYGKDCDSSIFKRSSMWQAIENNTINLPPSTKFPGSKDILPYFFVGDEAFALDKHLLRPYGGSNSTLKKRIFNYRLSRARRYVECTFGILSNKWRIFHRPINLEVDFAVLITNACVVLHNYVRNRDGYKFEDSLAIIGLDDDSENQGCMVRGGAMNIRDKVADYFLTDAGKVSWQMSKI